MKLKVYFESSEDGEKQIEIYKRLNPLEYRRFMKKLRRDLQCVSS